MSTNHFLGLLECWGPTSTQGRDCTLKEARDYCRGLARAHYENFTVASLLLPRRLRTHFTSVYAYCRWADDLADEIEDRRESLALLDWWEEQLRDCYRGVAKHPVFVALAETIACFQIPIEPFLDLLSAFRQDRVKSRYDSYDELADYCRRSANPVGRIILHLAGCHEARQAELADDVCIGLQLANFCQDVAGDYKRGRVYLPRETLDRFDCPVSALGETTASGALRDVLEFEVDRAREHLLAGRPLVPLMPRRMRLDVALFISGGMSILAKIRAANYDVLQQRPTLSRGEKARLLLSGCWQAWGFGAARRSAAVTQGLPCKTAASHGKRALSRATRG